MKETYTCEDTTHLKTSITKIKILKTAVRLLNVIKLGQNNKT